MTHETILKVVISTLSGIVLGWTTQALLLVGRVDATEKALVRIEARLDQIARQQTADHKP